MAKYRVDVSEPAENDLRDIVRYIASQLSAPISATRMMELFEEAMLSLSDSNGIQETNCKKLRCVFFHRREEQGG
jgi:plasmid stabilization system protein ParE